MDILVPVFLLTQFLPRYLLLQFIEVVSCKLQMMENQFHIIYYSLFFFPKCSSHSNKLWWNLRPSTFFINSHLIWAWLTVITMCFTCSFLRTESKHCILRWRVEAVCMRLRTLTRPEALCSDRGYLLFLFVLFTYCKQIHVRLWICANV